ncbi:MAG: hypothetical protein QM528_03960 [Phycisphaerales bacterium]|nr:hypothetical protein [Phycisphaerales bacterium]
MNTKWFKTLAPHFIAIIVIIAVNLFFLSGYLDNKYIPSSDGIQFSAIAKDAIKAEAAGKTIYWSNNMFCGMPTMSNGTMPQVHTIFNIGPLTIPFHPFKSDQYPLNAFIVAGLAFYFLSQVLKINPWIGLIASFAYSFSTFMTVNDLAGHITKIACLAWIPAIIGGLLLITNRKQYWWGAFVTAFAIFNLLAPQHLQIVYYAFLIIGLFAINYAVQCIIKKEYKQLFVAGVVAVIAVFIGLGNDIVPLVATKDFSKTTMRGGYHSFKNNIKKAEDIKGLPIDYAFQWSENSVELFSYAFPYIYGGGSGNQAFGANSHIAHYLEDKGVSEEQATAFANQMPAYWGKLPFTLGTMYCGLVILLLSVVGLFFVTSEYKWWLVATIVLGAVLTMGKHLMFINEFLFNHLPFYNKFRTPNTANCIIIFGSSLLAILALQEFLFKPLPAKIALKKLKLVTYVMAGIFAFGLVFYSSASYTTDSDANIVNYFSQMSNGNQSLAEQLYHSLQQDRKDLLQQDLLRYLLIVAIGLIVLFLFVKGKIKPIYVIGIMLFLLAGDLITINEGYIGTDKFQDVPDASSSVSTSFTPPPYYDFIKKDSGFFRVLNLTIDPFNDASTSYFFNTVGGYSPAKLAVIQEVIDVQSNRPTIDQPLSGRLVMLDPATDMKQTKIEGLSHCPFNQQVLNMFNAKYIITLNPQTQKPILIENQDACGNCWFVKKVTYKDGLYQNIDALNDSLFNPATEAIVDGADKLKIQTIGTLNDHDYIKLVKNNFDTIDYESNTTNPQYAVFSEIFYVEPGWTATIDGDKTVPIIRTDYALRGINVPAGQHHIQFIFVPAVLGLTATIYRFASLITWAFLILAVFFTVRRTKKQ